MQTGPGVLQKRVEILEPEPVPALAMRRAARLSLVEQIAAELARPVDPRVAALAAAIAAKHGTAARAVLFYGSCLRTARLDGEMLDFYLIVSNYREAYGDAWLARANQYIPPNVFAFAHSGLQSKYAVLSEDDFHRLCGVGASTVSVWARFAQPARLAWTRDEAAREAAARAVARAPATLLALSPSGDLLERWRRGFALTYGAELRAERGERPGSIVDHDPERYRRIGEAVERIGPPDAGLSRDAEWIARKWRRLRRNGKLLTVLRLGKASMTFSGGIDYLAWKINRHAGTKIEIAPWQRRWPLVAAVILLPRLLLRGSVR